jgi:hypothetical protein
VTTPATSDDISVGTRLHYVAFARGPGGGRTVDRSEVLVVTEPRPDGGWRVIVEPPRRGFEPGAMFGITPAQIEAGHFVVAP